MATIKATDVKRGDVLKLWFGTHTVTDIKRYIRKLDFILNILVFEDGNEMSN